jgi:hypothetical protein
LKDEIAKKKKNYKAKKVAIKRIRIRIKFDRKTLRRVKLLKQKTNLKRSQIKQITKKKNDDLSFIFG